MRSAVGRHPGSWKAATLRKLSSTFIIWLMTTGFVSVTVAAITFELHAFVGEWVRGSADEQAAPSVADRPYIDDDRAHVLFQTVSAWGRAGRCAVARQRLARPDSRGCLLSVTYGARRRCSPRGLRVGAGAAGVWATPVFAGGMGICARSSARFRVATPAETLPLWQSSSAILASRGLA